VTSLATFSPPNLAQGNSPVVSFAALLVTALTANLLVGCVLAAGEEIGWRGYMLTRLIDSRVPQPLIVSGIIWGLWHTPLIFSGQYAAGSSVLLSVFIFLVGVVGLGVLTAHARLATGSIWPPIVLHGAWNSIIQGVFDRATTGADALLWTGESGILVAASLVVVAVISSRQSWPMLRTPDPASRIG
jgi:membrane protease YdiL (CAAX protease family)